MVRSASTARLAEVVASLSLATDLATGQPLEHALRRSLLAVWLGEELGISSRQLNDVYHVALLGTVGCAIEGVVFARYGKDDIALSARVATVDPHRPLRLASFGLMSFGAGEPLLRRIGKVVTGALAGTAEFRAVCRDVAVRVGDMIGLEPAVQQALAQCHELWDGSGGPRGLRGEDIDLAARVFHVAHDAEIFNRIGGIDCAVTVAGERSGKHYDPAIADRFRDVAEPLLRRLDSEPAWDATLAAEPGPQRRLTPGELDEITHSIANFVDCRSPYTLEHSPGVGDLAERTARQLGLADSDAVALRHAGHLHDLGRVGVPVALWDKAGAWTAEERERAQSHPALTELLLARSPALGPLGTLAGLHHERLDGSGYRSVTAAFLPVGARILAAADCYRTKIERRPHRRALSPDAAAGSIRRMGGAGELDRDVVDATLEAAGHPPTRRPPPGRSGLSERELEVLRLVVQGLSNRQMAEELFISPKTVGHHVQHIYDKIGVSTRVGATLFALQHSLVESPRAG
jgi:HD-GYP domain-containing protein (c-di-GMP phosphodiesterase class II)